MVNTGSTLSGLKNATSEYDGVVVFVGQNPSAKATKTHTTFGRLNDWVDKLGIDFYGFVNASDKVGSVKQSDVDLDNLRRACYNASRVIALGNFAAEALQRAGIQHFKLPHPSPLNRQINDHQFINQQLSDCRDYLV
jgi:hypothetical protein